METRLLSHCHPVDRLGWACQDVKRRVAVSDLKERLVVSEGLRFGGGGGEELRDVVYSDS